MDEVCQTVVVGELRQYPFLIDDGVGFALQFVITAEPFIECRDLWIDHKHILLIKNRLPPGFSFRYQVFAYIMLHQKPNDILERINYDIKRDEEIAQVNIEIKPLDFRNTLLYHMKQLGITEPKLVDLCEDAISNRTVKDCYVTTNG